MTELTFHIDRPNPTVREDEWPFVALVLSTGDKTLHLKMLRCVAGFN